MLSFTIKFFFHNRKRTYQAVLALTLGLIIFIATSLLVRSYGNNIAGIASIISSSNKLVIYEKGKTLSESRVDTKVLSFLYSYQKEVPNILVILPQLYFPIKVSNINNITIETYIRALNLTTFENYQRHTYEYKLDEPKDNEVIIGQQLAYMLSVGRGSILFLDNEELDINQSVVISNIIHSGQEYDIEIITPFEFVTNISEFGYYSFIELRLQESKTVDQIKGAILENCPNVEVMEEKQTQNFIKYATDEVIKTLYLLQALFFMLMLVTITYSIYTLVIESEEEIIVLRSIGATNFQIIFLFVTLAIIIGLISSLLGLTIGYFGVCALVGFISGATGFPYIALELPFSVVFMVFVFSLTLSVLSSIIPALAAAKIKIRIEEL